MKTLQTTQLGAVMTVTEIRSRLDLVAKLEAKSNPDLDDDARLALAIAELAAAVSQLQLERALRPLTVSQRMEDLYNEGKRDALI
jgi:hypothetical protein